MITVSSLLDDHWHERYKKISRLNIRSSIYDVTDRCNLRCKGCFFFSSGEHERASEEKDVSKWHAFVEKEMARGVNLAILIGGEPTLCLDRIEAFYKRLPTFCATNGLIKVPRDRFPDMMVGISLWGDVEDETLLRGKDTFKISSANYEGDPHAYYLYTITPKQLGKTEKIIRKIKDVGLKVHMQLLSNDEGVDGFSWQRDELIAIRAEMDAMLDEYGGIRREAVSYYDKFDEINDLKLKDVLVSTMKNDPESMVRSQAVVALYDYFVWADGITDNFIAQIEVDSSYEVISDLLRGIAIADSTLGLEYAMKFEGSESKTVLFSVAEIYSVFGTVQNNAFFIQTYPKAEAVP